MAKFTSRDKDMEDAKPVPTTEQSNQTSSVHVDTSTQVRQSPVRTTSPDIQAMAQADRMFAKLDECTARRVLAFLNDKYGPRANANVADLNDPRR
jgi:hypothetical protein